MELKNLFLNFYKNKYWILSLLFVISILRDYIWYACFGVNILLYTTIQDLFISYFNYFSIVVFGLILIIYWELFKSNIKRTNKAEHYLNNFIRLIVFSGAFFAYFLLFKRIMSLLSLFLLLSLIVSLYRAKMHKESYGLILSLLFFLSFIQPFIEYGNFLYDGKSKQNSIPHTSFVITETNTDFVSFSYVNHVIDTRKKEFYMIGNNSKYFFIFSRTDKRTLIIPKDKCENISAFLPFEIGK